MLSPNPFLIFTRKLIGLGDSWDREPLLDMIRVHGLQQEWQLALAESN